MLNYRSMAEIERDYTKFWKSKVVLDVRFSNSLRS